MNRFLFRFSIWMIFAIAVAVFFIKTEGRNIQVDARINKIDERLKIVEKF